MPKVAVDNEQVSKMDKVLNLGLITGEGSGKRARGSRAVLLRRILDKALEGSPKDIARRHSDANQKFETKDLD